MYFGKSRLFLGKKEFSDKNSSNTNAFFSHSIRHSERHSSKNNPIGLIPITHINHFQCKGCNVYICMYIKLCCIINIERENPV